MSISRDDVADLVDRIREYNSRYGEFEDWVLSRESCVALIGGMLQHIIETQREQLRDAFVAAANANAPVTLLDGFTVRLVRLQDGEAR